MESSYLDFIVSRILMFHKLQFYTIKLHIDVRQEMQYFGQEMQCKHAGDKL